MFALMWLTGPDHMRWGQSIGGGVGGGGERAGEDMQTCIFSSSLCVRKGRGVK